MTTYIAVNGYSLRIVAARAEENRPHNSSNVSPAPNRDDATGMGNAPARWGGAKPDKGD